MNEINVRNEILDSIDDLNQVTMESTLDVFGSLVSAYDKADMIMEYSNTDDLSMFSIFQEAEVKEGDAKTNAGAKKQSFGYRLIHFIPNLIKQLIEVIKKAWTGVTTPKDVKPSSGFLGLLEKCKGKTAEWVKAHGTELGITGAALATLASFIAWQNSEKIKEILATWFRGLKAFFVAIKTAPSIAFDGSTVITNIKKDGLINTFKKLCDVLKRTNAITKDIAERKKSVKDISTELSKIIEDAKTLQQFTDIIGEEANVEMSDLIDLIENIKGAMDDFSSLQTINIGDTAKPLFEDNSDPSLIADTEKKCGILTKLVNAAAAAWAATSNAVKSLLTWIGEGLGIIKKGNEEIDSSAATVTMTDQSSSEGDSDIPGKDTAPISNPEVDKAVVAAQENPTEETITTALKKSTVLMDDINTASDPKKMQLVSDTKASVKQAETAIESGKVPADKGTAKKVGKMIHAVDEVASVAKKDNPTQEEINKATGHLIQATRVASIQNTKGEVSEEDKAKGQLKTKNNGERYVFKSDGELMSFLNKHLGKGNPVQNANMAEKTITYLNKKGKKRTTNPGAEAFIGQKLVNAIGNISTGKIRYNDGTWIIEFAEDELDKCIMMLESAFMEYLGENETFVVEYADGTTEEVSSLVMEAYEEESSSEDAAIEEINNHWYR